MRRVFAEIFVDEDKQQESNESADMGTLDYIQQEFGWLEQSGIHLERSMIADDDDESMFARYLGYLSDWVLNQPTGEYYGEDPLTYSKWLKSAAK